MFEVFDIKMIVNSFIVLAGIVYIFAIYIILLTEKVIEKKDIWEKLSKALSNGANVDVLNNIVQTQKKTKNLLKFNTGSTYKPTTTLAEILTDLKSNEYIENEKVNHEFIELINNAIREEKTKSPFDGLDEKQKDLFETIVNLLDKSNFEKIQNNINKISNELALKSEESKKAKSSFTIAIISIVITVLIGIYQIYDSGKTSNVLMDKINYLLEKNT